jgi:hypothetical protein
MIAEKDSMAQLSALQPAADSFQDMLTNLTSSSKVAVWRLIFYVVAVAIWVHEGIVYDKAAEVDAALTQRMSTNARWMQSEILAFQFGDPLIWNGEKYVYPAIDATKQVVQRCAVVTLGQEVTFKVAQLTSGKPAPLSTAQLTALRAYVTQMFPPGYYFYITRDADDLKLELKVYVDQLLIYVNEADPNDVLNGSLLADPSTFPVLDAIAAHIELLDWNGVLNLTKLTDSVQHATGVIDPILLSAQAKYGLLAYTAISENYTPNAGHLALDEVNSTITYVAANV